MSQAIFDDRGIGYLVVPTDMEKDHFPTRWKEFVRIPDPERTALPYNWACPLTCVRFIVMYAILFKLSCVE